MSGLLVTIVAHIGLAPSSVIAASPQIQITFAPSTNVVTLGVPLRGDLTVRALGGRTTDFAPDFLVRTLRRQKETALRSPWEEGFVRTKQFMIWGSKSGRSTTVRMERESDGAPVGFPGVVWFRTREEAQDHSAAGTLLFPRPGAYDLAFCIGRETTDVVEIRVVPPVGRDALAWAVLPLTAYCGLFSPYWYESGNASDTGDARGVESFLRTYANTSYGDSLMRWAKLYRDWPGKAWNTPGWMSNVWNVVNERYPPVETPLDLLRKWHEQLSATNPAGSRRGEQRPNEREQTSAGAKPTNSVSGRRAFGPESRSDKTRNIDLGSAVATSGVERVADSASRGLSDPDWADAHRPVVECSVSLPAAFDPLDPYAIVTYSNTSDRCPAYEYVPVRARERVGIGPDVSFDGAEVEMVDPEYDSWPAGEVEIPPLSAVSITYRIGDKYKIRPTWGLIRVRPVSQNYLQYYWFEFDRSGLLVSNGTQRIRSYSEMISNTWSDIVFREHIRSDIRRYAELRANGEATPVRIKPTFAARTPTNSVPGIAIVSNTIPYFRLPEVEMAAIVDEVRDTDPAGRRRSGRWLPLAGFALALLCAVGWAVRRHRIGAPHRGG